MEKLESGHPDTQSEDIVAANLDRLRDLFPEAFTEGKVDFDVLRDLLGDAVETGDEKYGLTWHGKRKARRLALTPSTGTLRPAPEESVDWDTTHNLMIEGDNLEVLKLLQKSYSRKVKAIYIDPPYNTGRNIVYPNDYSDGMRTYLELTGQLEGEARLTTNPETDGRFHGNWLSMIYPRLKLAKNLLRPDGVLFCTIDENEFPTLALIMKDIFNEGSYTHAYVPIVHNPRGQQGKNISYVHENAIIVYPADGKKYISDVPKAEVDSRNLRDSGTQSDRTDARNCFYPFVVKDGAIIAIGDVPENDYHPPSANVPRADGSCEVWPMTDGGDEKKWRYARASVPAILDHLEPKMGRESLQIIYHKATGTMRSVWQDARYDASEYGTKLLDNLVGGAGFTFPKSLWAVYDSIKVMTADDPDAIVMDFFAGSGTTGHAVMELNKEDGGRRRFVLVQLPEPLDPDNKDQRAAAAFCDELGRPRNIAELTKERLRRAGARIKENSSGVNWDRGFRVFKLDSSNIRPWDPQPDDLESTLFDSVDHLKADRTEDDILFEVLLKLGLDLTVPMEERTIAGKRVRSIGGGMLFVCLATEIGADDAEALAEGIVNWRDELDPVGEVAAVFRDSGFENDVAKSNVAAILEQHGVDTVRSL